MITACESFLHEGLSRNIKKSRCARYCNSKYYVENFDFSLLLLDIHDQHVWLQPVKAFCMKFWAEIPRNSVPHFSENSMLPAHCFKSKYYAEMFAVASIIVDLRPSLVFQHRCKLLGCLIHALCAGYLPSRTYEFIHLTCVLPGRTYELVFWKYFFFLFFFWYTVVAYSEIKFRNTLPETTYYHNKIFA